MRRRFGTPAIKMRNAPSGPIWKMSSAVASQRPIERALVPVDDDLYRVFFSARMLSNHVADVRGGVRRR